MTVISVWWLATQDFRPRKNLAPPIPPASVTIERGNSPGLKPELTGGTALSNQQGQSLAARRLDFWLLHACNLPRPRAEGAVDE